MTGRALMATIVYSSLLAILIAAIAGFLYITCNTGGPR
jgi:hypothetical protein